jgi:hypothetical protein
MRKFKRNGIVLLLLALTWHFFPRERASHVKTPAPASERPATAFSPLVVRKPAAASAQPAPDETSTVQSPPPKPETEQECWDRVINKLPETPGFLGYVIDDLDDAAGTWVYDDRAPLELKPGASKSARFYYALARAGFLLAGEREFERNDDEAYDVLMKLAIDDGDNSAPLLFLAALQKRKPEPNLELIETYLKLARDRSHFDTYKKDVDKAVMKHVRTPEDYVAASSLLATAPEPEVAVFKNLLKDKEFAPIAKQMMADGLKVKKPVYGVNFVHWEYLVGEKILANMGVVEPYPSAEDLFARAVPQKCYTGMAEDQVAALREAL